MNRSLFAAIVATVALMSVVLAQTDYSFFVSGYPAENKSYSAPSSGKALVSGTLIKSTDGDSVDARYRTTCASPGRALRSDGWQAGMLIIVR